MTPWLLLALGIVLVAGNGLFVAAEFALVTVDRSVVEREADGGDGRAGGLLAALRQLSTQLSGAQLGITVTSLVVGYLAEPALGHLLQGPVEATGLPAGAVVAVAATVAVVASALFQMLFGELVPKNLAVAVPLVVGQVVAPPMRLFTRVTMPLIKVLNGSANAVLRLVGVEPQEELASARSPRELASLVSRSGEEGTLDTGTAELVARSIEFGDRTAADVMTPRPRVHFLQASDPVSEVVSKAADTGHARFPVFGSDVDEVVGVVHFKHALAVPRDDRPTSYVADAMADIDAVPSSMELDPLLATLRRPGLQVAVVVDEYGGTAGIVTLEDLLEEIVGEIQDEQDRPGTDAEQLDDGSWSVPGLMRPDEAGDLMGLDLPEGEETDTLAGLVTEELGQLPAVDDAVTLEARDEQNQDADGLPTPAWVSVRVSRLDGRRVERVVLTRLSSQDGRRPGARRLGSSDGRSA